MSLTHCDVCSLAPLTPLWHEGEPDNRLGTWHRCPACGSDSSELTYQDVCHEYRDASGYERRHPERIRGVDMLKADIRSNLDWIKDHAAKAPNRDFLDIGCCEGAALVGMRERGWGAFGYDVCKGAGWAAPGNRIETGPFFNRWLFNEKKFGAILCREVIEHVEGWRHLLHEVYHSLAPGGLFQVQTPRPTTKPLLQIYARQHLRIFSPASLENALVAHNFEILDGWVWEIGHAWLCQRK